MSKARQSFGHISLVLSKTDLIFVILLGKARQVRWVPRDS